MNHSTDDDTAAPLGESRFRRETAHALSTPLGSLLLQAELIDHYLRQAKLPQAREAMATLLHDFETFGRQFRSAFSAMADIAEESTDRGDPRSSLSAALAELGEQCIPISYRGPSPQLALSEAALTALMRRLAMLATESGMTDATLVADTANSRYVVSLGGAARGDTAGKRLSLDPPQALHLAVAREIAARHGGHVSTDRPGTLVVSLPLAPPRAEG